MATTIQVSKDLIEVLKSKKMHAKESYEEIIWDLLEDHMELSEQTKKDIEKSRRDIAQGKVHTLYEVKKKLGI